MSVQPFGQSAPVRAVAPMRAVAIVPARLASTRLPEKLLLAETGTALLVHTLRNAQASGAFAAVVAACDDERMVRVVQEAGLEALMTRVDHPSGSDRIREAWDTLAGRGLRAEVVVGLQGDEPELPHDDMHALLRAFDSPEVEAATLGCPLTEADDAHSPSVVKVVRTAAGDALYFSRAAIPAVSHTSATPQRLRHVGVYAWRPAALARFVTLPRGVLEQVESLEQLRWLEHGGRMRVVNGTRSPRGVDLRDDYEAFVQRWRARTQESRTHQSSAE